MKTANNRSSGAGGVTQTVNNRIKGAGGTIEAANNRSNSIGVAKEAANNGSNRAGGGGAERLITTGATVLEEPEKPLTTRAK